MKELSVLRTCFFFLAGFSIHGTMTHFLYLLALQRPLLIKRMKQGGHRLECKHLTGIIARVGYTLPMEVYSLFKVRITFKHTPFLT